MDRLTRYNQKVLAIIGTIVILAAGIGLLVALGSFIISIIDSTDSGNTGLQIQNQGETDDDSTFVRTQEVTFDLPHLLDSAQNRFLFPVGQVNLEEREKIGSKNMSALRLESDHQNFSTHYGLFNNFILYENKIGKSKKLFNERIAITQWAWLKRDSIEVLLFKGTKSDDNSDNRIDHNDYQSIFAYYLQNDDLKKYDFGKKTVLNFEPMNNTHLVSIIVGIDKDRDFDFERISEPMEIRTLNIYSKEIEPIISEETKKEIQGIVDGIKN